MEEFGYLPSEMNQNPTHRRQRPAYLFLANCELTGGAIISQRVWELVSLLNKEYVPTFIFIDFYPVSLSVHHVEFLLSNPKSNH